MKEMLTKIHGQPVSNDFTKDERNPTEQWESKIRKTKGTQQNNGKQSQKPKEPKGERTKIRKPKEPRAESESQKPRAKSQEPIVDSRIRKPKAESQEPRAESRIRKPKAESQEPRAKIRIQK
jgi:hypothetical protein